MEWRASPVLVTLATLERIVNSNQVNFVVLSPVCHTVRGVSHPAQPQLSSPPPFEIC